MTGSTRSLSRRLALAAVALLLAAPAVLAQTLTTRNDSFYAGNGYWQWTVFLAASPAELSRVSCVVYELHPTFPNPVRRVCSRGDDPRGPFALTATGWGTFPIQVTVEFRDGSPPARLMHMLEFSATSRPVERPMVLKTGNTSREAGGGRWEWTVYIQGAESDLAAIRCVEYTLHPTFPNPEREVCDRGVGPRAFALNSNGWGTFQIGIRVFLRSGEVQELSHKLRFGR